MPCFHAAAPLLAATACSPVPTIGLSARAHWQLDSFFGYQFLNGCNPYVIRQCKTRPQPGRHSRDGPAIPPSMHLSAGEMERGTIFLADYEILEGVPANSVNGRPQHLAAPLCLLYRNQQGELLPIAIQLKQTPGPHNPVFLPSDSEADWLLAKIWVRNSDFQCHQLVSHYLKTHMLGEAYCVATLRHLPGAHRYTRFVEGLLQFFYPSDRAVQQDSELQSWITDLYHHAFLGLQQTGIPQSFQNRAELVKFVTMVIFSCSAQHAAVNFSQLDFDLWMPNCPASLRQPPSSKGSRTSRTSCITSLKSTPPALCCSPWPCCPSPPATISRWGFTGPPSQRRPSESDLEFQADLRNLGSEIDDRNAGLELPYRYLRPDLIENSVSI
ncbi:arachidonate 15-lipoxygenase B-like [Acipenser oxyrinchus oxyrinchus]|uniref:Arachidonate 15-lipoxygenase B-like n=1 Tax=Acipenser oxyrinchus oxyrinchus TaxID=40147 RepID=A0AAD8CEW9_ACIOX|nr:arachidonate 15-lipoxygenase B-like [Acipenser oxyrinchus oxyrinchus]